MTNKILIIGLLLLCSRTYSQRIEKLKEISLTDFETKIETEHTVKCINDIHNLTYDYRVKSNWYAGAMDEYFTAKYDRNYRLVINPRKVNQKYRLYLHNCMDNTENQTPKSLKVLVYEISNNKITKHKIKKKQLKTSKEGNEHFLSLPFLKSFSNNIIVDISYQFKSSKKSNIRWYRDDFPIQKATFNVFIPEIYTYNLKQGEVYKELIKIEKSKKTGPMIGYEMTMGSSTSGYKLFPKEWVDKDKSGRAYQKVNCNLNSYFAQLSSIDPSKNMSDDPILTWELIGINEIDIK